MKNLSIKTIFTLLILWWIYLFFVTQIVVVFDAEGYEQLGQLIYHHGWQEYFRGGLNREPLFPAIVAFSMYLGDLFKTPYFYPLKIIGIIFLFLTALGSYRLMRILKINNLIACAIIFYLGVSPVMTNSSMRLWSEFAVYPWVVLVILWTVKSWNSLKDLPAGNKGLFKAVGLGAGIAGLFLLIMFVKAVAEGVILCYLWPFYLQGIIALRAKNFQKAKQVLALCLTALVLFEGVVLTYKYINYQLNHQFGFTSRGDYALYGYTARRMEPLTISRIGAAIALTPDLGICSKLFKEEDCFFWSARHSDDIVAQKNIELQQQGLKGKDVSNYYITNSIKMILSNPLQQLGLMFIEAHKIFFWESSIAFVTYPDWLENILYSELFSKMLKVILGLLSWGAYLFVMFYLWKHRVSSTDEQTQKNMILFWVFNFIFWYTAMYSLYFILDRYSYPLISLFMVLIAFTLDKMLNKLKHVTH